MRVDLRLAALLCLIVIALESKRAMAQERVGDLSSFDRWMLLSLLGDYVFDPGPTAERVRIPWEVENPFDEEIEPSRPTPDVWEERTKKKTCEGWLVKDKRGDRVFLTEGFSIPVPPQDQPFRIDFVDCCRRSFAAARGPLAKVFDGKVVPQPAHWLARELGEESELVIAAWLLRLGHGDLAAKVLTLLPNAKELELAKVHSVVAFAARHGLVEAFHNGREVEALEMGRKLMRLRSDCVQGATLESRILVDLRQREKQGTLRVAAPEDLPSGNNLAHYLTADESVERFNFEFGPNTPLEDLLPAPPRPAKCPESLVDDLTQVPEVLLQDPLPKDLSRARAIKQTALTIARINHLNEKNRDHFVEALMETRSDLVGLPFLLGDACRTTAKRGREFARAVTIVREARRAQEAFSGNWHPQVLPIFSPAPGLTMEQEKWNRFLASYTSACIAQDWWASVFRGPEYEDTVASARVAALMQILGPESPMVRLEMVKYLAGFLHPDATQALARTVLFAPEANIRSAAIRALRFRRESDYVAILTQGFRYPVPAVAKRASEAVIALKCRELLPKLADLLDEPDPRAPVFKKIQQQSVPVVRELVKINHARNCLLCHAPANSTGDSQETFTAPVPVPDESESYYAPSSPDLLVRFDVTYLRQDFSMLLPVAKGDETEMQRFDFLVRSRVLMDQEAKVRAEQLITQARGGPSPYRLAVLHALRELTGKDTMPTSEAWRRLLARRS
jgi:hypothetical protein